MRTVFKIHRFYSEYEERRLVTVSITTDELAPVLGDEGKINDNSTHTLPHFT